MNQQGDEVITLFQSVPPPEGKEPEKSNVVEVESRNKELKDDTPSLDYSMFGERTNMEKDNNFEEEILWFPFKYNLVEVPFTKEHEY